MAHGGYARRRPEQRRPLAAAGRRSKAPRKKQQVRSVSLKNQIRSAERLLRKKDLPPHAKAVQVKKLDDLKRQQDLQNRLANERGIQLRDRKVKFFERRKIERRIRRLEKKQRLSADNATDATISSQLSDLRKDLEYVRFFPKNEKYVPLFSGNDNGDIGDKRNEWRKQIQQNLISAAASGKDLEETASDDDALDLSDDGFFMSASSSDEEADDEWTDKSAREAASSASGRAASGMSSDEKNQRQAAASVLMPPPRSLQPGRNRLAGKLPPSTSSYTSNSTSDSSSRDLQSSKGKGDHNSNLSSNSDVWKPRRKRRHRKKKNQNQG